MRLFALAALVAFPAMADDMIAKMGDDILRLTQGDCSPAVLVHIPDDYKPRMKAAYALIDKKSHVACWILRSDGMVVIQYADGDLGMAPLSMFRREAGI